MSTSDIGLLVLRLGFATLLFGYHGWGRLVRIYNHFVLGEPWGFVGFVESIGLPFPLFFALASSFAEAICSVLVGLGIATRVAAFFIVCNLLVALYTEASTGQSFDLPGLYLTVAVSLLIMGGGKLTVMRLFGRK
jgi:putative oxidoreductase